jgi:hypothetical protein
MWCYMYCWIDCVSCVCMSQSSSCYLLLFYCFHLVGVVSIVSLLLTGLDCAGGREMHCVWTIDQFLCHIPARWMVWCRTLGQWFALARVACTLKALSLSSVAILPRWWPQSTLELFDATKIPLMFPFIFVTPALLVLLCIMATFLPFVASLTSWSPRDSTLDNGQTCAYRDRHLV